MATLKLAAPVAALLVAWFTATAYCVSALATFPAALAAVDAHQQLMAAPALPVSVAR